MIDINQWMKQYQDTVKRIFDSRILFIGLQGSYGRSEANEDSDIDVVLILDKVSLADLKEYKETIETLPYRALMCGFVSGKEELEGWCRADLFQFYHDTISYYGNLDAIITAPTDADARSAVLTGACNLTTHAATIICTAVIWKHLKLFINRRFSYFWQNIIPKPVIMSEVILL